MSRISIDVTPEQHNRSKAFAALTGKSLKDYIFEKTLPTNDEFKELEDLLVPRVKSAYEGNVTKQSAFEVADEVYIEFGN